MPSANTCYQDPRPVRRKRRPRRGRRSFLILLTLIALIAGGIAFLRRSAAPEASRWVMHTESAPPEQATQTRFPSNFFISVQPCRFI